MSDKAVQSTPRRVNDAVSVKLAELGALLADGHAAAASPYGEKLSALAFDQLLAGKKLTAAGSIVEALAGLFPGSAYFANMRLAFATLPPASGDAGFDGFRDDPAADVQVVPRRGAETVLLGFCGSQHKMTLPLTMMHRWFGQVDTHVIYLRDRSRRGFLFGAAGVGDYPETLARLRALIARLAPRRIVCQGHSAGGYGALRMGLDLGADAVLVFGATTSLLLEPAQQPRIRLMLGLDADADLRRLGHAADLRLAYAAPSPAPLARLVYSGGHVRDVEQAENMRGLPGITLEPVGEFADHGVFYHVLRSGRYREQLAELVPPPEQGRK